MEAGKHIADLPDHLLERILGLVPLWHRLRSVELVCKDWLAPSRSTQHFESLDMKAEGFEAVSNMTLQALLIASLGSRLLAKQLGHASQLHPSPLRRLSLQGCVWRGPAFDWLGPQSVLARCPCLEELVLPLLPRVSATLGCHPNSLPAIDTRIVSRPVKLVASNLSVHCSLGSFNPESAEDRVAWQCLLNLLRPTSWVQVHTLVLRQCRLGPGRLRELASALAGGTLHTLNLTGNPLNTEGAVILVDIVRHVPLHTLAIWDTDIKEHNCAEFVEAVAASCTLQRLFGLEDIDLLGPAATLLNRAGFQRQADWWVRHLD